MLIGLSGAGLAERPPHTGDRFVPKLRNTAMALDPPVLYLSPRETGPFLDERRTLMQAVAATEGDDAIAHARAVIDLAEFHLAHGMAVEGLSLLAALDSDTLPPAHALRVAAFELALGLIDLREKPLTERAAALLQPGHDDWADQTLFKAIHAIQQGDLQAAGPMLEPAVTRLARFPAAVQERVLPGFLECAIETRQWQLARDLAAAFDAFPALDQSPAYHFLLGQAAEAGEDPVAAFDSYTQAMAGRDLWAHRARRALVTLGLKHEALTPEEAVELLSIETHLWRGDAHEKTLLNDLAALQVAAGDRVAALETYGTLIERAAGTAMADAARQKAHSLMDTFYRAAAGGELSLSAFMAAHKRVARHFRFDPTFAEAAERFADTFLASGATTVAANEFATIHDYLTVAADLGVAEPNPGQLGRLRVKRAEALLAGGQYDALGELLERGTEVQDPAMRDRMELLAARYFSETGQSGAVVTDEPAAAEPSPQILAIRAEAHFERGNWAEAERAYAALWNVQGSTMSFPHAINFLLAAYRSGNMQRTASLAEDFPKLTTLPGWSAIASGLSETAPELLPLREDSARARIEKAQDTLEALPQVSETN